MNNIFLDKKTTIAVIGYGRFGKLMVEILKKNSPAKILIVEKDNIKDVKNADVIIPCVPISSLESVAKQIAPIIKKEAIIIDICSVKVYPVKVLKKHLANFQIIATHPMFGPDSYRIKKSLKNLRFVIWNISADQKNYLSIKKFFKNLGLKIVEISPEDHDKYMAHSLGYSYLIGKIGQKMNIKKTPIDTYDFELLLEHLSIIKEDSEQLFIDMQTKNPFAKSVIKNASKIFEEISKKFS